ncbi:MAG TPA: UDP-glucose/GDP-mannose dehydrogenase family protein [Burkholderiaceae bacterium]|nr:UDP-glucose/GDP-mannose dehydrogenase family protein [Burkholderiaceae bacterium]
MRVCVVGTGYVGLVSGACLAEVGHQVTCVDIDPAKVDAINRGQPPIFEEGLEAILARNAGERLRATTSLADAFAGADVALICVGTPFDGQRIDLSYVLEAARQLGRLLRDRDDWCVIAVKSTVIPGTTDGPVREALEQASGKTAGVDFGLGMNPEFLAEGVAVRDFMEPDRIVVGGIDERSIERLAALYSAFPTVPLVRTTPRTAEAIKYASNALLATLISFSNELARYCEAVGGVDVADVMPGVHRMKHLTWRDAEGRQQIVSAASFLWAGCGFGGSCFPKDVKALIAEAHARGAATPLLDAVIRINESQPQRMVDMAARRLGSLRGRRVTVLGLAFKPGTDDVRESPAVPIIGRLLADGAQVVAHDPIAIDTGRRELAARGVDAAAVRFEPDLRAALAGADAVLLVTRWPQYANVPALLGGLGEAPVLIDGRRQLSPQSYSNYVGVGLADVADAQLVTS